ncbi:MAG TPA: flagellar hook-basal body complex protein FliE [Candidatus Limnocylindrales bacterium]
MDPISGISAVGTLGGVSGATGAAGATGVGGVGSVGGAGLDGTTAADGASGQSFVDALGQALGSLNGQLVTADASMADFAAGGSADLHTVLLQMQEASLGLKLGIQVRDRLLDAYNQIMRLQV